MPILLAEASFISAERGLCRRILSRTSLKCHMCFDFIPKLVIFIHKQLKRLAAFGAVHFDIKPQSITLQNNFFVNFICFHCVFLSLHVSWFRRLHFLVQRAVVEMALLFSCGTNVPFVAAVALSATLIFNWSRQDPKRESLWSFPSSTSISLSMSISSAPRLQLVRRPLTHAHGQRPCAAAV